VLAAAPASLRRGAVNLTAFNTGRLPVLHRTDKLSVGFRR